MGMKADANHVTWTLTPIASSASNNDLYGRHLVHGVDVSIDYMTPAVLLATRPGGENITPDLRHPPERQVYAIVVPSGGIASGRR
jgi:hypothetical protein